MKMFMEGGIEDLAKMSLEEIESSKHVKDDIDVGLSGLVFFIGESITVGEFFSSAKSNVVAQQRKLIDSPLLLEQRKLEAQIIVDLCFTFIIICCFHFNCTNSLHRGI